MKNIFTILFLFIFYQSFAQNWYVDNTGTGDTLATIAEVNALGSGGDDTIFFKRGCLWRETLTIPGSGTTGHYVVYTTYGTGDNPQILGSKTSTWTAEGHTNIWQSDVSLTNPQVSYYAAIWFEELDDSVKWGDFKTYTSNFSNLVNEYDWTWNANKVYVYAATDPDTRYNVVEVPQRSNIIELNSKEYLEFNGIDLFYSANAGINEDYPTGNLTGFISRNSEIAYLAEKGHTGFGIAVCYNNMLIEYDTIHDCGRRAVSVNNYGSSNISNVIIQYCAFYNGFHTTGVDIETGADNGIATGDLDSVVVRNCLSYEDEDADMTLLATQLLFAQGPHGMTGEIHGLYIYNNIFMYSPGRCILLEDVDTSYIYNNTFYGHNSNGTSNMFQVQYTDGCTDAYLKNNIFYSDLPTSLTGTLVYEDDNVDHNEIDADYNLYYRLADNYRIITANGNAYYRIVASFNALKSAIGWEINSPYPTDPLFINITSPMEADSLMIDALSPAVDAGIGLGSYTTLDYNGNARDGSPDIGAIEYGAAPPDFPPDLPTVTTSTPVVIYTRLASGGGNVTDDGGGSITSRGICWSTSVNPTTSDSKVTSGTGTGIFSGNIQDIKANTTYHIRAFAINPTGTAYGSDLTFKTPVHSIPVTNNKVYKTQNKYVIIH